MRKFLFVAITAGAWLMTTHSAKAQYFDYTSTFSPNPIVTSASLGSQYNVTAHFNSSGIQAGAFGSQIIPSDFVAVATSNTPTSFDGMVTETISLIPSTINGTPIAGDSYVSHTFTPTLDIENLDNSDTESIMTAGVGAGSPIQTYSFADGSVFTVQLSSYTGPGAPGGTSNGALQAQVFGALAGVPQGSTPEPGSMALLVGMGVVGTGLVRRRRAK
jgi:hypothetical protein